MFTRRLTNVSKTVLGHRSSQMQIAKKHTQAMGGYGYSNFGHQPPPPEHGMTKYVLGILLSIFAVCVFDWDTYGGYLGRTYDEYYVKLPDWMKKEEDPKKLKRPFHERFPMD